MKAADFLAEQYFKKAEAVVDGITSKSKTFTKFYTFFREIGEYYGKTRESSAFAAMVTLRSARFAGKAELVPVMEALLRACQSSNIEPKFVYTANVCYGCRTAELLGSYEDIELALKACRSMIAFGDRFIYEIADSNRNIIDSHCE